MRIVSTVLLFLPVMLNGPSVFALGADFVQVVWVDDGDTVVLADGRRVRYIGINAPEVAHEDRPAEPFGPEARDFNRRLVLRKMVRLEFDGEDRDQFGRTLAYLFLPDNTLVNAELVRAGLAHYVFRMPGKKYDSMLLDLQRQAMEGNAGMWAGFEDRPGPFPGDRSSRRFHLKDCSFGKRTSLKREVVFETRLKAFRAGYSPCKRCNP